MNINATLLAQMITFGLFVWFTLRYVWPPITAALDERRAKIAEGLAAAERGERAYEEAQSRVEEQMRLARQDIAILLERAQAQSEAIVTQAKHQAVEESQKIHAQVQRDLEMMANNARQELQGQISSLALLAAERILQRSVNKDDHERLVADLIKGM
ncbi:MAG: F0F1 ATP synthase subunit B [Pseudomonadota bacterium]